MGAIIGAGYMERESSKALDLTVSKMALMHLSEEDFHQLFAEGIEAGLPNAEDGPEISTGLLDIDATAEEKPRWCKDPKFSHFISHRAKSGGDNDGQTATITIADMLKGCKTDTDLLKIIQGSWQPCRANYQYLSVLANREYQTLSRRNCETSSR